MRFQTKQVLVALSLLLVTLGVHIFSPNSARAEQDETADVRRVAGPSYDELVEMLGNRNESEIAIFAAASLATWGPAGAQAIADYLADPAAENIDCVLFGVRVAHDRPELLVPAIQKLLNHHDSTIRLNATATLGELGKAASPTLQALLKMVESEPDTHLRNTAIQAVGAIGGDDRSIVAPLIRALEQPEVKPELVFEALGKAGLHAQPAIPILVAVAVDKRADTTEREKAILALGNIATAASGVAPLLTEQLSVPQNGDITIALMVALENLGAPNHQLVPLLQKRLTSRNWNVQGHAAEILGRRGAAGKEALPLLSAVATSDSSPRARIAAATAIHQIGGDRKIAIQALTSIIQKVRPIPAGPDDRRAWLDYSELVQAIDALGDMNGSAKSAVPLLKELYSPPEGRPIDSYIKVRVAVIIAIEKITGETDWAITSLLQCLGEVERSLDRIVVIDALGAYGLKAEAAAPALSKIATTASSRYEYNLERISARKALQKIQAKAN